MSEQSTPSTRVTVVDFDIPFGALVSFMVKLAIAAIPAYLVIVLIFLLVFAVFGGAAALVGLVAQ